MIIRGLYHTPLSSLELCKDMGFTHTHLLLENGMGEEFYAKAHALGLHCLISEGKVGMTLVQFLAGREPCPECLIAMPDEPNLRNIKPQVVKAISDTFRALGWQTFCALSFIRSYRGYENVASHIGFSQYEDWTTWRRLKMLVRLELFRIKSKAKILAIMPVKPGKLVGHWRWWVKWIKPDGVMWYSATPTQESPPWSDKDLIDDIDSQHLLKSFNLEHSNAQ